MDPWLRKFVERQMATQASEDPATARLLAEAGGMRLFGTIGAEVFLRPDGTTVALIEGAVGEPDRWQGHTEADRISALVIALKRFPELGRLLPIRPESASDCPACAAAGRIHGVVCGACSGLGWVIRRQPNIRWSRRAVC
jgi:hypothetical protein